MGNRIAVFVLLIGLAACGGEQYSTPSGGAGGAGGGGGEYTGLLIDMQRLDLPLRGVLDKWTVVDQARSPIFSSDQVKGGPGGSYAWEFKRAKIAELTSTAWLGNNFYEIDAPNFELSEDQKTAQIIVGDATAATLRGMANLNRLVQNGRIIVLVGKLGE